MMSGVRSMPVIVAPFDDTHQPPAETPVSSLSLQSRPIGTEAGPGGLRKSHVRPVCFVQGRAVAMADRHALSARPYSQI